MKKVYHILTMFCLIVTLSVLGFGGFLFAAGRLTPENREVLSRMLRGEDLFDPVEAPTTQPATSRPATVGAGEDLAMSEQAAQRTEALTRRSREELKYRTRQLEILRKQVQAERKKLADERIAWAKEIEAARKITNNAGFKRELELYETMDSEDAKRVLVELPEDKAARFLAAMDTTTSADIIAEFTSPADQAKLQRLLTLMREM